MGPARLCLQMCRHRQRPPYIFVHVRLCPSCKTRLRRTPFQDRPIGSGQLVHLAYSALPRVPERRRLRNPHRCRRLTQTAARLHSNRDITCRILIAAYTYRSRIRSPHRRLCIGTRTVVPSNFGLVASYLSVSLLHSMPLIPRCVKCNIGKTCWQILRLARPKGTQFTHRTSMAVD